jgi:hypothetical protein
LQLDPQCSEIQLALCQPNFQRSKVSILRGEFSSGAVWVSRSSRPIVEKFTPE